MNKAFRRTHSRREADRLVAARRVRVNGEEVGPGHMLAPGDLVTLDGAQVEWEELEPSVRGGGARGGLLFVGAGTGLSTGRRSRAWRRTSTCCTGNLRE